MPPRVAVVVVNWMEPEISLACVRSVLGSGYPELRIVVVDNGSPEDPTAIISGDAADVEVIRLPVNAGYPAAANAGARHAIQGGADFLFFLNNDATIDGGAIPALLENARHHQHAIHAPCIVYAHDAGRVWSAGGTLVRPWMRNHHRGQDSSAAAHAESRRVEWATGCALFVSVADYERIGPFDERFFLYLEDVDWCLRAAALGIPTWYVGAARVRHAVSTTNARRVGATSIRYYAYRNYYRLAFRHAPRWGRPLIAGQLAWTLTKIGVRTAFFPGYRHDTHYQARTHAVVDFLRGRWGPAPAMGPAAEPFMSVATVPQ